ncbi:MAG: hypothetical protein IKB02_03515 [Clostridia bacterium]|nr:hypothetical protein [Clostridia bacterium]
MNAAIKQKGIMGFGETVTKIHTPIPASGIAIDKARLSDAGMIFVKSTVGIYADAQAT